MVVSYHIQATVTAVEVPNLFETFLDTALLHHRNVEQDWMLIYVITACSIGFYGMDCVESCNINCGITGRCNKSSGQCDKGCQPGWRGIMCDTSNIA
jgi:hypothetical protein